MEAKKNQENMEKKERGWGVEKESKKEERKEREEASIKFNL